MKCKRFSTLSTRDARDSLAFVEVKSRRYVPKQDRRVRRVTKTKKKARKR